MSQLRGSNYHFWESEFRTSKPKSLLTFCNVKIQAKIACSRTATNAQYESQGIGGGGENGSGNNLNSTIVWYWNKMQFQGSSFVMILDWGQWERHYKETVDLFSVFLFHFFPLPFSDKIQNSSFKNVKKRDVVYATFNLFPWNSDVVLKKPQTISFRLWGFFPHWEYKNGSGQSNESSKASQAY